MVLSSLPSGTPFESGPVDPDAMKDDRQFASNGDLRESGGAKVGHGSGGIMLLRAE